MQHNDKLLFFRSHGCSAGLSDESLREICDAAELIQYETGDYVCRVNEPLTSVYLVAHGRLKQSIVDMHGHIFQQRFVTPGSQHGALGAALTEPVPIDVIAVGLETVRNVQPR